MKLLLSTIVSSVLLSGCLTSSPTEVCQSNITQEHIYMDLLEAAQAETNDVAVFENRMDNAGRFCGPVRCSILERWGYVEAGALSQYISLSQVGFSGAESADKSFACRAALSVSLPNGKIVPHSVSWTLTPAKPHPMVGTLVNTFDPQLQSWIHDHTRAENRMIRDAKALSRWVQFGWTNQNPLTFGVHAFEKHLKEYGAVTGVDYYGRLTKAFNQ
jgi:hypothetical protein